jgi:hypothetical protein
MWVAADCADGIVQRSHDASIWISNCPQALDRGAQKRGCMLDCDVADPIFLDERECDRHAASSRRWVESIPCRCNRVRDIRNQ